LYGEPGLKWVIFKRFFRRFFENIKYIRAVQKIGGTVKNHVTTSRSGYPLRLRVLRRVVLPEPTAPGGEKGQVRVVINGRDVSISLIRP